MNSARNFSPDGFIIKVIINVKRNHIADADNMGSLQNKNVVNVNAGK